MIKSIIYDFKNLDKHKKTLLLICLIIGFFTSVIVYWTFNYMDGQSIMAWAVNNWDLLVEGRWGDFYTDKALNLRGAIHSDMSQEGMISPFMYLPTMLWCFPIWVTHYFNGNLFVGTIGCVYWYKLFLLVLTIIISLISHKNVKRISGDGFKAIVCFILVFTSSEILLSTGYAGQDEVVYLCFLLLAMDSLTCNKMRMFAFWGTLAVTCSPLIIIPLFSMLILKEKHILKILGYLACFAFPTLLWSLLSSNMADKYVSDTLLDQVNRTFDYITIPVLSGAASLMLVFLVAFYFYCYLTTDIDERRLIWLNAIAMIYLCFFTDSLFYRSMLYIPFMAILVMSGNMARFDISLLLVTVIQYLRFFTLGIDSPQVMNTIYSKEVPLLVSICDSLGSTKYQQYDSLMGKIIERMPSVYLFKGAINGICLASILILLWITYSKKNESKLEPYKIIDSNITLVCMPVYMLVYFGLLFH